MKKRSKQRFSIRKSNFGVVSVLLGTFALLSMNISASANEIGTSIDGGNNNSTISLGESDNSNDNSSDVFRDTSVDLTSDIRETNYVTDAIITLSDDYIEALEERNTLMNALKGQNDDLTDRNLPKKSATDSDNIDNLNRLSQLGEEHLRANTYDGSADTRPVDPLNLTDEQFEELNIFGSDIANQIRQQVIDYQTKNNKQVTVELAYVSEGMQDFAKEVTERVQAKDLQVGISGVENLTYEVDIINSAAKNHYLDTTAADYETKFQGTPNQRPASLYVVSTYFPNTYETWQKTIRLTDITMGQMKEIIYQGYLTGLFTLAAENREHRKWEHALNITSLETRRQPHIQPNTMIGSGLTFIQRRAMAQDAAGNWTVVAGLSGDYYPVFNFYQDSYSPVEENRIYYGETAPGYTEGFNTTLLKNVEKEAPVITTETRFETIENGVEERKVTLTDGVVTSTELVRTFLDDVKTEVIPYETTRTEDSSLVQGEEVVDVQGVNGSKKVGTVYTVEEGQLKETKVDEIITEPITKEVRVGTKELEFEELESEETSSDETSSDETSSDEISSDETSSDEISSDEISSDETSSDEISSDETSSDEISSDEISSDETSSDETSSDETSSDETSSDEISSDEISSDETSSDEISSDEISSDETSSEEISSDEISSDETSSEEISSDETSSDEISSDEISSDEISSDETSSDEISSDETSSDEISSDEISSDETSSEEISSDEISSDETSSEEISSDETSSDEISSDEISSDEISSDETSSDEISSDETSSDETSSDETSSDEIGLDGLSSDISSRDRAGGAGMSLGAQGSVVTQQLSTVPTYSRVARAQAEKSLPNTGEVTSVLGLLGAGISALGLAGIKRRKK